MEVTRDEAAEDRFYADMADWLSKRDRERRPHQWHVSDLLAPRKAYWKITDPRPLTRDELGYFLAGRAHHEVMEAVAAGEHGQRETGVCILEPPTVVIGTPDVITPAHQPIEAKTSRKWTIDEYPEDRYLDQLACYCTAMQTTQGQLLVFYLTPGRDYSGKKVTKPRIVVWSVTFTEEELAQWRTYLVHVARSLDRALEQKDHTKLPLCESWQCKTKGKTKKKPYVVQCPYFDQCKPEGRWPLEQSMEG